MIHAANVDPASGAPLDPTGLTLIREVVESCAGLSRKELAQTVCELLVTVPAHLDRPFRPIVIAHSVRS
jgi:hypothetical protein